MKAKILFSIFVSALVATTSGFVVAGPGDKGKGGLVIEHTNGSDEGNGSVLIDVSLPAAISHLDKHAEDCVVEDEDDLIDDAENCEPDTGIVE